MPTPRKETFENECLLVSIWQVTSIVAFLWAIFSIVFMWDRRLNYKPDQRSEAMEVWAAIIITSWVVGPAGWFSYENWLISDEDKDNKPTRMRRWRLARGDAKALWVAIATRVLGLYVEWH
jgi:hypothetical protein